MKLHRIKLNRFNRMLIHRLDLWDRDEINGIAYLEFTLPSFNLTLIYRLDLWDRDKINGNAYLDFTLPSFDRKLIWYIGSMR